MTTSLRGPRLIYGLILWIFSLKGVLVKKNLQENPKYAFACFIHAHAYWKHAFTYPMYVHAYRVLEFCKESFLDRRSCRVNPTSFCASYDLSPHSLMTTSLRGPRLIYGPILWIFSLKGVLVKKNLQENPKYAFACFIHAHAYWKHAYAYPMYVHAYRALEFCKESFLGRKSCRVNPTLAESCHTPLYDNYKRP